MVKVSFRQKLCIVLPITGSVCLNLAVAGGILKFYTDYVGLSPIYYGIAYILFGIWNGINDPVFGYYLTKHQPKPGKGKYRKVMLRAIPLLVLSYIILITMSPSLSQISLFIILIIGLFLYDATYTLFFMSLVGLSANITDDPQERANINTLSTYLIQIPSAIVGLIPLYFLTGEYAYEFLVIMFLTVGILGSFLLFIGSYFIKERIEWYKDIKEPLSPITAIKECFKTKGFKSFILFTMCSTVSTTMFAITLVYYLGDVWRVWGFWAILPAMIGGGLQFTIMYPLTLKIRKKIGTYKTMYLFEIISFFGYLGFFLVTSYWVMIFFYFLVLTGMYGVGLATALTIQDLIDADMINTGERRGAMFEGIRLMFVIPVGGFAMFLFTIILEITGYNGTPGAVQTPEVIFGIRFAMGGISMIFIALSIIIWCFFPLHGESYIEMRAIVEEKFKDTLENRGEDTQER